jgi:hypothetical protein
MNHHAATTPLHIFWKSTPESGAVDKNKIRIGRFDKLDYYKPERGRGLKKKSSFEAPWWELKKSRKCPSDLQTAVQIG